jgi:hypothetical protein
MIRNLIFDLLSNKILMNLFDTSDLIFNNIAIIL